MKIQLSLLFLSLLAGKAEKSAITIPWFAVLFIAVAGLNSFNLLPATLVQHLITDRKSVV